MSLKTPTLWSKLLQKTLTFVGKPVAEKAEFQFWPQYFLQQPSTAMCHQASANCASRVTNRTLDFVTFQTPGQIPLITTKPGPEHVAQ